MAVLDDVELLAEVEDEQDDKEEEKEGTGLGRGSTNAMWLWGCWFIYANDGCLAG